MRGILIIEMPSLGGLRKVGVVVENKFIAFLVWCWKATRWSGIDAPAVLIFDPSSGRTGGWRRGEIDHGIFPRWRFDCFKRTFLAQ